MNAKKEVERLRAQVKLARQKRYYKSRLDPYAHEIQALRAAGATYREIQLWLREHRVKVHRTSISRFLSKIN
jgi:DNA-binding CsgD family transcriptional regulator